MLSLSRHVRVFLACDPVDMRKSFTGLVALTESILREDPLSGHLFVFINRRRDTGGRLAALLRVVLSNVLAPLYKRTQVGV